MALTPCRECKKRISTEAVMCPSCGVPNPTAKLQIDDQRGKTSRALKLFLLLVAVGVVSSVVLQQKPSATQNAPANAPDLAIAKAKLDEGSPAEIAIKAEMESVKAGMGGYPDAQAEQLKFGAGALDALSCIEFKSSCTTFALEGYLKGLPIGWIERVLGPPQNEQRLAGKHFYYWTFSIDEGGRRHRYRLQLEFGLPCPLTVNRAFGACTFNFYG